MFETMRSPRAGRPTAAQIAADMLLLAALGGVVRAENEHAYHKVATATEFHRRWVSRRTGLSERHATAWSHAGWVEIATTLACSASTAHQYVELGTALRERLPRTRAAFAAGEIDYAKAWRLATATAGFSAATTGTVESEAIALAGRSAPAGFAAAVEDLLIRTAPDEYADLRRDAVERARRVRRRKLGVVDRIEADLAPHEAAAVWQRLGEVAATVCSHDPRDAQKRLVDAYLALMHGEDHLACTCERLDCAADPTVPSRRTPLVQIIVDTATLLGLRNEPAYLPGHGPIDPDLARELAQDSTWQALLTELVDLATAAGILTPEQAASHATTATETPTDTSAEPDRSPAAEAGAIPEVGPTGEADTTAETDAAEAPVEPAAPAPPVEPAPRVEPTAPPVEPAAPPVEPAPPVAPAASPAPTASPAPASAVESALRSRLCHPRLATFVARGSRRRSGYLPACPQAPKPILVSVLYADIYDQFVELLATRPEFAAGMHPDGHGGMSTPPPGALTYRPSAELAARVRARDRTCRYPGCTVPAAQCQLDHVVSYDHDNPEAGGWTIESNLQAICRFNHELKTVGLWHAVALPGMAILWTGPRGDRHLTLPAGGLTPVPAADLGSTADFGPSTGDEPP